MRFIVPALLATVVAVPAWSATAASADTWPQYRGANRDGISTEKLAFGANPPEQVWKASLGIGFTSIAVAGGLVYASGNADAKDTLHCLDAKTGKSVWTYTYPQVLEPNLYEGGPNATPTVAGKNVYLLAKDGFTACLDAKTGKEVWKKNLAQEVGAAKPSWGFSGSPTVLGRALFLNVGSHGTAVEAATGKVVWKSGGDAAGYASVIPLPGTKDAGLLVFAKDALVGVDAASGRKLWSFPWTTDHGVNAADPIMQGGQVFLSTGYNYGCGLVDISGGQPKEVWRNKNMKNHFNACVLIDGHLYGFDDSNLKCLDWKTGQVKWDKGGLGKGSLAAVSGKLVILSERGELVIADATPSAFTEISRTQALSGKCWSSPAIADGRIYVRNAKGDLVCLAVK
jgi:outer membrane protein assembly factor BamB